MSTFRKLKSLKLTCIQKIAKDFEKFWFKPFEEQFGTSGKLMHIIGPFDDITSNLNQLLIDVLVNEKLMKTKYLQLLISARLVELNLSRANTFVNSDAIVNTIAERCHKLTKLNLSFCNKISAKALENMVSEIPTLQALLLGYTKCNDRVMDAISQHCHDLRLLDVTRCPISHQGLNHLMAKSSSLPCPKLQTLKMRDCHVGKRSIMPEGVFQFLSQRSKLMDIDFGEIHIVMKKIHKINNSPTVVSDNLQYPRMQQVHYDYEIFVSDLELICQYCPNLTKVELLQLVSNDQIRPLSKLRHLQHLQLVSETHDGVTLSFKDGISPLLASIGDSLHYLQLVMINDICLSTLGRQCPHLTTLDLIITGIENNLNYNDDRTNCFPELQEFKCLFMDNTNVALPPDSFSVVLKNTSQLRLLDLGCVQFLTSEELGRYLNHNVKPDLDTVVISNCDNIDGSVFHHLLTMSKSLSFLSLTECKNVTRADFNKMTKYCKQYSQHLKLEWT